MAAPDNFANTLIGTSGNDIIHGLGGDDIIEGAGGIDQMYGDADNDTFRFRGVYTDSNEIVDGGAGDHDKLDLSLVDYSSLNIGIQTVTSSVFVDLSQNAFGATLIFRQNGVPFAASSVVSSIFNVEDVVGSSGNDVIVGNGLNNTFNGGAGVDNLSGGGGNDTFLVTGRWFDDGEVFDGGAGTGDTIDFSGVDYTDATSPNMLAIVVVDLSDEMAGSIVSPSGDIFSSDARITEATVRNIENVVGSKHSDLIIGNALSNTLSGGDGADELDGGDGLDTIFGGRGADVIKVSGNYDTVSVDRIDGGEGIDTVDFSDLTHATGNPHAVVDLVTGAYSLGYRAGQGGGGQFSSIAGVFNVENFVGAAGANWIASSAVANNITGGGEDDTVSYQHSTAAVTIERDAFAQDAYSVVRGGYAEGDTLNDIEFIVGSDFNDRLIAIEEVTGGRGADTFSMFTSKIHDFRAAEGDVIEIARLGDALADVHGLSDLRWIWVPSEALWYLDVTTGPSLALRVVMPDGRAPVTAADSANAFTDDMFVFKSAPGTGWNGSTDAANNLVGTSSADKMVALGGNDVLTGNGGADRMYGGEGNDRFVMNGAYHDAGDVADGGRGLDTLDFSGVSYASLSGKTGAIKVDLGAGTFSSTITTTATGAKSVAASTVSGVENVTGSTGGDTIRGNSGNNVLDGGGGIDQLQGFAGNDTFYVDHASAQVIEAAGQGIDTVYARASYTLSAGQSIEVLATYKASGTEAIHLTGNEVAQAVRGNAGNNLVNGGRGNDTLTGNAGFDTFVFDTTLSSSNNVDTITDFSVPQDSIRLENAIFTALTTTGTLAASAFHIGTAAADSLDRIIYNSTNGRLYYDADGTGAGGMSHFATLSTGLAMTNLDFVVV